ncbi:MAG TPA: SDR family NAD(P)-dependent oxidoreductase, partial [Dehalococcoidales bacterium]|nr:SDR family NAD(P)-dependent oxidoreductase [Dehalococcoidales bacterium]
MGKFDGKVALVTGCGNGIGKGIMEMFAREGADIVANDINPADLAAVAVTVGKLGRKIVTAVADVTKKDEVVKMADAAVQTFGKVDILVNNAGISRHAPFLDLSEEEWDRVVGLNLKGTFLVSQAVARHMVPRKYGKIINISSSAGIGAMEGTQAHYGPSKAAVINLTKVMAIALGENGINVNCIAPGVIITDTATNRWTAEEYKAFVAKRASQSTLARVGAITDVINAVSFLASDDSAFISGQVIPVDGGLRNKLP